MKLSVIIVNYNVKYFLDHCLLSVQTACKHIDYEIIVVDNHSTDESCTLVRKNFPEVILISNKENVGFSKANNHGVKIAKGEYILILNPDTYLSTDCIKKTIEFADIQKDIGAIGVKLIDGTGNFLPESKRNYPTLSIALNKIMGRPKKYYATHLKANQIAKVDVITGAFMLIKREAFNQAGGFDESYFMYGEDIDLCYTLTKNGLSNYYFGESTIIHYKGESTIKDKNYLKRFYGAMLIFYKKYYRNNHLSNFSLKLFLDFVIQLKSIKKPSSFSQRKKFRNFLFIGNNDKIFIKLKNKLGEEKITQKLDIPDNLDAFDCVIFDNVSVTNSNIINVIDNLSKMSIGKRILPKNRNYYLGSDYSTDKGEVTIF